MASIFCDIRLRVIHNSFHFTDNSLQMCVRLFFLYLSFKNKNVAHRAYECAHLVVNWAVGKCVMACRMIVVDKCVLRINYLFIREFVAKWLILENATYMC